MAIDIPYQAPIRLSTAGSTDIYTAPSTPSSVRVTGMRLSFMHDGTSTNPVSIAVHHVISGGTYGNNTQVDQVVVSQNRREVSKLLRLGPGGKVVCAPDVADMVTVDVDSGVIFS